jgi:tRNA (Thr-GGU) A37 N-methylase
MAPAYHTGRIVPRPADQQARKNPIGLQIVAIGEKEGNRLIVAGEEISL